MTIEKEVNGSCTKLILSGWMDTENAPQLAIAVDALDPDVKSLVLDMSGLEYMSSAGIRQLIATHKRMNGEMTLRNVQPVVMDVLSTLGLDKKLNFEP
ncbi:MAG: STAS domain-containing protein [Ruminiclostridium sp.]|nr:STAS domain-containing protein [Ruminiclostridium sp.]